MTEKVIDLTDTIEPELKPKTESLDAPAAPIEPPKSEPESEPKIEIDPILQALSVYSANLSYYAMSGILGYVSRELGYSSEDDYTEFAREVLKEYKRLNDAQDVKSLGKALYNPKRRTDLILCLLWSLKPQYRNACMQLMLQSIGCFEIAGRTFKIQQGLHSADPAITENLKAALFESLKPELKDDFLVLIELSSSFLKQHAPHP